MIRSKGKRASRKASSKSRKPKTFEEQQHGRHYSLLATELEQMAPDHDIPEGEIRKYDKPGGFYVDTDYEPVDLDNTAYTT